MEEREPLTFISRKAKLFGVLTLPKNPSFKEPYPLVIFCHGMAGSKVGQFRVYVKLASYLALKGIASYRFDFLGCGDSEGSLENLSFKGEVEDTLNALEACVKRKEIDASKISILGRSMGGAVAFMAAAASQKLEFPIKKLCVWAALFDGSDWKNLDARKQHEKLHLNGEKIGGHFVEELLSLDLRPSFLLLKKIPFLHIQGAKDSIVQPYHQEQFKKMMKDHQAECQFFLLPGSDHSFSNEKEREFALEKTVNFFS